MKKQISYHYRLYLEVAAVILALLLFCVFFFFRHDSLVLRESVEKNTLESLTSLHTRLDDRMKGLDNVAKKIAASPDFLEIAAEIPESEGNYFLSNPSVHTEVNNLLISNLVSEELGTNIHYVTRYLDNMGVYMQVDPYDRAQVTKEKLRGFAGIMEGLATKEYVMYQPPHNDEWTVGSELAVSIIRPVRNNFETFGVLEVSQGREELDSMMTLAEFPDDYAVYILDKQGELVYEFGEAPGIDEEIVKAHVSKGEAACQYLGSRTLICTHSSQPTEWTLVMARDLSYLDTQMRALIRMMALFLCIALLTVLVFLYLLTKSLTKPLRELKNKLCMLELDEEIHLDVKADSNEVTALSAGIEDILNQIREQNRSMVEIRKRAVKAHLDRMEAQMNPHFLYNALTVIGACGQEDGSERVYQMTRGLAQLLRYSIKYEHNLVAFCEEIQNIRNYLLIMSMRYEEQVEVAWDLDQSLDYIKVPKLSFQPVLENCFKHGFVTRTDKWRIVVSSVRNGQCWLFRVKNNGVPFEEEQIERIRKHYRDFIRDFTKPEGNAEEAEPTGLGLENTLKRLYIQYGTEAYWDIRTEDAWTVVEIGGVILE
ncbi:histidine kinase [Blautia schinkii]|nr:histidine kinase [Blautia schinkii]